MHDSLHDGVSSFKSKWTVVRWLYVARLHTKHYGLRSSNTLWCIHCRDGYWLIDLLMDLLIAGIHPQTHSPGMISWFPIFFPIRVSSSLGGGACYLLHFWPNWKFVRLSLPNPNSYLQWESGLAIVILCLLWVSCLRATSFSVFEECLGWLWTSFFLLISFMSIKVG